MKTAATLIVAGLFLFLLALIMPDCRGKTDDTTQATTVRSDTTFIHDTIYIAAPDPADSRGLGFEVATLPAYHPDRKPASTEAPSTHEPRTGRHQPEQKITVSAASGKPPDSVAVVLPIVQRHYLGDSYEAWVSGHRAALDSLRIYPEGRRITVTRETTKWRTRRWGISVGVGAVATPKGFEPGIFIGATYTFLAL